MAKIMDLIKNDIPEYIIIKEVVEKQIEEKISKEKISEDVISFLSSMASKYHQEVINNAYDQISKGIKTLAINNDWPNLLAIAREASQYSFKSLQKESPHLEDIVELLRIKSVLADYSIPEMLKALDLKWLENNSSILKKRKDKEGY